MARKKTRKGGLLAPRKNPDFKANRTLPEEKVKKGKGRKSGSRQAVDAAKDQPLAKGSKTADKRIGSKKPIALVKAPVTPAKPAPAVVAPLSDEAQLAALEADPRLIDLLDRADDGELLSDEDQSWMSAQLEAISALMDKLGIVEEDDDDELESDWDSLDDGGLADWREDD